MNDSQEITLAESRYARVFDGLLLFLRQFDGEIAVLAVGSPGCQNEVSRLHLGDYVLFSVGPERYEVRLMAAKGGGRREAQAVILVTRLPAGSGDTSPVAAPAEGV